MLVPLRLLTKQANKKTAILWQNPTSSSTKYCRAIKIIFRKETKDFVKDEIEDVKLQIANILSYNISLNGKNISIFSAFHLTMIDGKICSWLADTAGQVSINSK